MKKISEQLNHSNSQTGKNDENDLQGYPIYSEDEDIYRNFKEEEDINPEDTSKTKEPNSTNTIRKKDLDDENHENDLDIPGSELDDLQEDIGNEDEENNYYSIGGDDHLNLDEDQED